MSKNHAGSGKLSEEKAKVSKLEVHVEVLEKRTAIAERSLKEAKDTETQVLIMAKKFKLKDQLKNLERLYMESKEESIKVESEMMDIRLKFEVRTRDE